MPRAPFWGHVREALQGAPYAEEHGETENPQRFCKLRQNPCKQSLVLSGEVYRVGPPTEPGPYWPVLGLALAPQRKLGGSFYLGPRTMPGCSRGLYLFTSRRIAEPNSVHMPLGKRGSGRSIRYAA
jgi:hypothetical protein